MITCRTVTGVEEYLLKESRRPVGFIPTMGALHHGHISLVNRAISDCPSAVVSIFVNPTQFNDKEDLKNYPRNEKADLDLLGGVMRQNDLVFIPDEKEIYPEEDKRVFSFGNLERVMEGLHRPGHFNGVAQVVSRLFDIVDPDIAYFGQKDFQQLTIIKELVRQTGRRVKISGCPIVRESDGLAMSSRNLLLEPEIRKNAGIIFQTLKEAAAMTRYKDVEEIKMYVISKINGVKDFAVEYFEIVDDRDLKPLKTVADMVAGRNYFGCIALRAGRIRLIDNIPISLD